MELFYRCMALVWIFYTYTTVHIVSSSEIGKGACSMYLSLPYSI